MLRVFLIAVVFLFAPTCVLAATIDHLLFTTDQQTIAPSAVSEQITIEAQDADDIAVNGNSVCMQVTSTSATGEFSTNATSWDAVPIRTISLTLSTTQYRRNFYYRDSSQGTFVLTAKAGVRSGTTCTGWNPEDATWTSAHSITVGSQEQNQETDTTGENDTSSGAVSAGSTVSSYVAPPIPQVFADAGDDRRVIVGADTVFLGRAYNRDQEIVDNVRFHWNFGDGTTAEGINVTHHFAYPGTYAVVLAISQHFSAASDRIVVVADPAKLRFSVHADGSVAIGNEAGREIDISRWIVHSFGKSFVFADGTNILSGQTLRIPYATLGMTVGPQTELLYPNGMRADVLGSASAKSTSTTTPPAKAVVVEIDLPVPKAPEPEPVEEKVPESAPEERPVAIVASSSQLAAAANTEGSSMWWWIAVCALALGACVVIALVKRMQGGEWKIIGEK